MNERILELAEQAGFVYNFDPVTWMKHEKFAELIIKECCSVADSLVGGDYAYHASYRIKRHFGVEE